MVGTSVNYTYVAFGVNEVGVVVANTACNRGPMARVVMAIVGFGKNPEIIIPNRHVTLGLLENSLGVYRGCNIVDNDYGKATEFDDLKYKFVYVRKDARRAQLVVIATDEVVATAIDAEDFNHFGKVNGYILVDYNPLVHIIRAECKVEYIGVGN